MTVVLNSTPVIYLAKIGRLDLLDKLDDKIYLPQAVYEETVERGLEKGFFDARVIQEAINKKKIEVRRLTGEQKKEADDLVKFAEIEIGEAEAIILSTHMKSNLIVDDAVAQGVARSLGLEPLWTTSLVILLVHRKLIEKTEARKIIEELVKDGYRIGEEVLLELLKRLD
ncbi:MAG: hypothetical protein ACE5K4_12655 [Candidatus Hydrothermarchaeota archaeon]